MKIIYVIGLHSFAFCWQCSVKPGSDADIFRNMMKTYVDHPHQSTDDDNELYAARHRSTISDEPPESLESDKHQSDFNDWPANSGPLSAEVADASLPATYDGGQPGDQTASRTTMNDVDRFADGYNELPETSRNDDERKDRRRPQAPVVGPSLPASITRRPSSELNAELQRRHGAKMAARCRYVPFVKPDQTAVQLVQICNKVPQGGSTSS